MSKIPFWMQHNDSALYGVGDPVGSPPFLGAIYVDVNTGKRFVGRNILTFNTTRINLPAVTGLRTARIKFKHNDPAPALDCSMFGGDSMQIRNRRLATTGNLSSVDGGTRILDGVSIADNVVNPSANVWHTWTQIVTTDRQVQAIGTMTTGAVNYWSGELMDLSLEDINGVVKAFYPIDEGSGTTIFDASGNGLHGTLTIGSGSWALGWGLL